MISKNIQKKITESRIIYDLLVLTIAYGIAQYLIGIVDYYCVKPGKSFIEYYIGAYSDYYDISILIVFSCLVIIFLLFHNITVSFLIVNLICFILSYASSIKFENRHELVHYSDLLLTETTGM